MFLNYHHDKEYILLHTQYIIQVILFMSIFKFEYKYNAI